MALPINPGGLSMAALAALRSPAMLHLCESDATAARQAVATGTDLLWRSENDGFMGRNRWMNGRKHVFFLVIHHGFHGI